MRRLEFHPLALREAREEALYIEERRSRYGFIFRAELDRNIQYLLQFPEGGPLVGDRVRRRSLKDFPVSIFYAVNEELLYIVAVAGDSREPGYWHARLDDIPIHG